MKISENLVRVNHLDFEARIWLQRAADGPHALSDVNDIEEFFKNRSFHGGDPHAIAELLVERLQSVMGNRINAVEVTKHNLTSIIYPSWP